MNRVAWMAAVGLFGSTLLVRAAEMKTLPARAVWVADSVTEWTVSVWLENSGLGGEPTDGAEWRLMNTPGLQYVDGSSGVPSEYDFFAGIPMFFEAFNPPGGLCGRLVEPIGGGPVDHAGYVGTCRFIVPQGTIPGVYSFELGLDSKAYSPDGDTQPLTISPGVAFTIAPLVRPDFNHDGFVDLQDYSTIHSNLSGPGQPPALNDSAPDLDDDEDVHLSDFAAFERCYTGDVPVEDPGCAD